MTTKLKCDGTCYPDKRCKGEVKSVTVIGEKFPDPFRFNYCETAIQTDRDNNFTVIVDGQNEPAPIVMKFSDAPIGARFKHPNSDQVWVKINSYPKGIHSDGLGLIAQWNGNIQGHQSFCCFVDEEAGISFDTEIKLV